MITTAELSKILGISRGTISRVLNDNPNVNEKTRATILAALKEYGYSPNHAARSLIMRKHLKIGVIVFSKPYFFWEQIKRGVDDAAASYLYSGLQVDYFSTDIANPQEQIETMQHLIEQEYDAIALAPNDPSIMGGVIEQAIALGIPVLLFNVDIPNSNRLCYVGSDYFQSGKLAAEILAKACNGKPSNIAVFTINDMILPMEQRIIGLRTAISEWSNLSISNIFR
ncbi:MAG: LacI family DNA-binding transcriptional regulator, partial [Ruthenibacterium sp.]